MGTLAVGWVCVRRRARGCSENREQTENSNCKTWLEGEAASRDAQLCILRCCIKIHRAGGCHCEKQRVLGSALFSAPLEGDAVAPLRRGEPGRACPHTGPPG